MVCNRCIKVVAEELTILGLNITDIELGKVKITNLPESVSIKKIDSDLKENGFELIDDKKSRLIDQIKTIIIELVHHKREKAGHLNISDFISTEIGYDYSYLSNLFSSVEGTTIEKYIINQKIERVKELLVYDELTLNEIAYQLGFSSVQHLSTQFKKNTQILLHLILKS